MLNRKHPRMIDIFGPPKRRKLVQDNKPAPRSCHGESMPIWGDPVLGMDKQFTGPRQIITFDGAVPHSEN